VSAQAKRTNDELREASGHLQYEVWMFMEVAAMLAPDSRMPVVVRNALVESLTVHARVLLNVFYPSGSKADDVLASDYFDDPLTWRRKRPPLTPPLRIVDSRVGKEVAHLTYARNTVSEEAKKWHFLDIARDMVAIVLKFDDLVPPERVGLKWRQYAKAARANDGA
jgi:hypothetical protein